MKTELHGPYRMSKNIQDVADPLLEAMLAEQRKTNDILIHISRQIARATGEEP